MNWGIALPRAVGVGLITLASVASGLALAATNADQEYQNRFDAMMADPANPERSFDFAQAALMSGDIRGAIASLERILKIDPGLSNIRLELGLLYLRVGSPDLAALYLNQALKDPAVPPWVRTRAKVLLNQAEDAADRHHLSGTISVAALYDSNANAGPSGTVLAFDPILEQTVNATLSEADSGRESSSLELAASLQYAYALDSQLGNQIEANFFTYNRGYEETQSINSNVIGLDLGPRFFFGELYDPAFSIRPYVSASKVWLDGDAYQEALGGGLNIRKLFGLYVLTDVTIEAESQDYANSTARPTATNRNGEYYSVGGNLSYQWRPATVLSLNLNVAQRDSEVDFESYKEAALGVSATQSYLSLFGRQHSWSTTAALTARQTDYDAADPSIDPSVSREDTRWDFNLSATIPVTPATSVVVKAGYTKQDSNLPNFEYDNWSVGVGLAVSL